MSSGSVEARLLIEDSKQSRRLGETAVASRLERLFAVEVALAPVLVPSGSQQGERDAGSWVNISGATADRTERAKVWRKLWWLHNTPAVCGECLCVENA